MEEILAAASGELLDLVREECLDLMEKIGEKTARINVRVRDQRLWHRIDGVI
ncbi:hypothetical protein NB311A_10675 [Nitrobacter sp. Nb-311A]|uniref:hypothetical protein n=1 Tax=unclassified Nitrobacter TaxID=2620411 RepID=UPI000068722E|nr:MULTISPECIES: hypothetical protein [unclassified Nitrobacter]EAQ33652.1 hypothetical protein NB311A_10675 [Nitrobacter sp. Nb-311A]MCV0387935.1 hypothetical protein [Nitrobacter sp.]